MGFIGLANRSLILIIGIAIVVVATGIYYVSTSSGPNGESVTPTEIVTSPKFMKGEELWMWIDSDNVYPYYVDCNEGSKSQMFTEGETLTTSQNADAAFNLTKTVFTLYQNYLCLNLTGENLQHFQNATMYQKYAIDELQDSDIQGYLDNMNLSHIEYSNIFL